MAKDARIVRDPHQKNIVKLFSRFDGSKNRRKIFEDFVTTTAIAISNVADKFHADEREEQYMLIAKQYKPDELDTFAEMMAEIVAGLEENQNQDFLGEMYMALDFGSSSAGQFFTPYSVCQLTASICSDWAVLQKQIEDKGFVSASDPACGAGALLVAFANECLKQGVNYQTKVLFVAQDLDYVVGMMCYIALSFMGCAGYVVIGDTLCDPCTSYDKRGLIPIDNGRIWYTPMFWSTLWRGRCEAAIMDRLLAGCRKERIDEPETETPERPLQRSVVKETAAAPVVIFPEPQTDFNVLEIGQLSFF